MPITTTPSTHSDIDELVTLYHVAYSIYKRLNKFTDALRVAIKVDKAEYIDALFADEAGAPDLEKKQMALLLGRHRSQHVLADSVSGRVLIVSTGVCACVYGWACWLTP